jgi:ferritin-like metal-binding protein YciE
MKAATPTAPDAKFLKTVFMHNLNRMYTGKCFLRDNLDHLLSQASFNTLQLAMKEFSQGVINQIERMDRIYKLLKEKPTNEPGNPIKSIIKDEFCLDEQQNIPMLNDLDLVLYVQLLEHVNITAYRMMIMVAKLLKLTEVKQELTENFDESVDNDKLFTLIAKEYLAV